MTEEKQNQGKKEVEIKEFFTEKPTRTREPSRDLDSEPNREE